MYSAEFLGTNNVSKGQVSGLNGEHLTVRGDGWELRGVWRGAGTPSLGQAIRVVIRVERVAIGGGSSAPLVMDHDASLYLGDKWEHRVRRGDLRMRAYGATRIDGGKVTLDIRPQDV
jgi:iron(III) transport system ATP-binding protein